jgi:hypothetical protein
MNNVDTIRDTFHTARHCFGSRYPLMIVTPGISRQGEKKMLKLRLLALALALTPAIGLASAPTPGCFPCDAAKRAPAQHLLALALAPTTSLADSPMPGCFPCDEKLASLPAPSLLR